MKKKKLRQLIVVCVSFLFISYSVFYLWTLKGTMSEQTLQYFLVRGRIGRRDAAEVSWCHGVNSRSRLMEALSGSAHMLEADVLMREAEPEEPVMAHPPDKDSDISLGAWLQEVRGHQKGIKLDFKSLEALAPGLALVQKVLAQTSLPVWINADVLPGPGGHARPLDPQAFLSAARGLPPHTVLSLGWTTGWTAGIRNPGQTCSQASSCPRNGQVELVEALSWKRLCEDPLRALAWVFSMDLDSEESPTVRLPAQDLAPAGTVSRPPCVVSPGYSWDMVHLMEQLCRPLKHAVSFPVRAALLAQSFSQLDWLLQQSERYTLTVWTGQADQLTLQDLLAYRQAFNHSRIYYDLPPSLRTQLRDGGQEDRPSP